VTPVEVRAGAPSWAEAAVSEELPVADDRRYDVIITGTGAGGGTLAYRTHEVDNLNDVDNLYDVDTSFFPSIGAVNPSLTATADALRVGDQLIERLG
jgi:choline dehydrogenase-like flavoprotein